MRPLYALTFQIDGNHLDDLDDEIRQWLSSKYPRWDHDFRDDGTPLALGAAGHAARYARHVLPGGESVRFTLEHPDDRARGLHWHTAIEVATDGAETECDVVLSTFVSRDGVPPPNPRNVRPPFLGRIIRRYTLRQGREPLALAPDVAATAAHADALADVLLSPNRTMPLVLVSDEAGGGPLVDADALQMRLLGSARVVRITSAASHTLSTRLGGNRLACYDGGVRLYWPGFTLADDAHFHKLYLKWEIRAIEDARGVLADDLFERITSTTSIRTRRSPLLQRLRDAEQQQREADFQRRLAEIGTRGTVLDADRQAYEQLLDEQAESTRAVVAEKAGLQTDLDARERELQDVRSKLFAAQEALRSRDEPQDADVPPYTGPVWSAEARADYAGHPPRQAAFDRLVEKIADETWRRSNADRCDGGGYVCPRTNTPERLFFDMAGGVVHICRFLPHHQDSLADAYAALHRAGVHVDGYDGFEPWPWADTSDA